MASATVEPTSRSIGRPRRTRSRISEEETRRGNPRNWRPREWFGEGLLGDAGAGNDDELGVLGEFLGIAPFG